MYTRYLKDDSFALQQRQEFEFTIDQSSYIIGFTRILLVVVILVDGEAGECTC